VWDGSRLWRAVVGRHSESAWSTIKPADLPSAEDGTIIGDHEDVGPSLSERCQAAAR